MKKKVQEFEQIIQIIAEHEHKINEMRLAGGRLAMAKEMLNKAVDRWDRDSIQKDIEELEWAAKDYVKLVKQHHNGTIPLENVQANEALILYNEVMEKQVAAYAALEKQAQRLNAQYTKDADAILGAMRTIAATVASASSLKNTLPNGMALKLTRLPEVPQAYALRNALRRLQDTTEVKK